MPPTDLDRVRAVLARYAEPLLRDVTARLVKPRTAVPADELADRLLATLANPPVVDRRIRELPEASRKLLTLIGLSRRSDWGVGHLITLLAALGHHNGFGPILDLLATGLLFPALPARSPEVVQFATWLGWAGTLTAPVFAPAEVADRVRGEPLGLPTLPGEKLGAATPRAADGLDWLLRLAVAWQRVDENPVRLTQANALFKRDLARLQTDPLLTAAAPDQLVPVADPGVLALFWAKASGLLTSDDGELRPALFPPSWDAALPATLADLWAALTAVESWDPVKGYTPENAGPAPTAGFLSLLLLATPDPTAWVAAQAVADWLWEHHPSWPGSLTKDDAKDRGRGWVEAFLLGVAYPLRLVEAVTAGGWRVRLTPLGRHLLAGGPEPPAAPSFPQTLLVQPNAEVLAYRQGLTPGLIAKLTRFAAWTGLGPACTLEFTPARTYRGLESGLSLPGVLQTLNQHGMRPVPPAVDDLVRRWANKRDRITVFASATLVEFQTPADLEAAIARGVVSVRVTDRIALTDDGRDPAFPHLRLIGNRDYEARPQQCLTVSPDGVTLTVDPAQSDLLLEAEIGRLADPVTGDPPGVRRFRISPTSLKRALATGLSLTDLDSWFRGRTGHPLTPAGKLFTHGPQLPPPTAGQVLVVELPSADVADGLVQWPPTAGLIDRRLGPTAVAVDPANLPRLREVLGGLGIVLGFEVQ